MELYHFVDPQDLRFARAGRRGTWFPTPGPGVCPECRRSRQERVPPLIIEWLPGSDEVGDFTWPGFNDEIVVTQRVREALECNFRGFEFHPIKIYQDPKLRRPERVTKTTTPRVWLPYEGLPLWDLRPIAWCDLDHVASRVRLEKVCSTCGRPKYSVPPFDERHLVVNRSTWRGEDIFQIREYAGWVFCTDKVKGFIESLGFTNVGFILDGDIPQE